MDREPRNTPITDAETRTQEDSSHQREGQIPHRTKSNKDIPLPNMVEIKYRMKCFHRAKVDHPEIEAYLRLRTQEGETSSGTEI